MKVAQLLVAALAAVLSAGAPITVAAGQAPAADAKVWDNYDFVPGNKVIFYTDFSEDRVGNFETSGACTTFRSSRSSAIR